MGKTMMGSTTHEGNVGLLTPEQQGYLSQAMSGLGGMMATGAALGVGSAVGREGANYMMGSGAYREGQPQQQQ